MHFEFAYLGPHFSGAAYTILFLVELHTILFKLFLLRFFKHYAFTSVADTFAFVRLRRSEAANFVRHLANSLFVSAFDEDFCLARCLNADVFRHVVYDRV